MILDGRRTSTNSLLVLLLFSSSFCRSTLTSITPSSAFVLPQQRVERLQRRPSAGLPIFLSSCSSDDDSQQPEAKDDRNKKLAVLKSDDLSDGSSANNLAHDDENDEEDDEDTSDAGDEENALLSGTAVIAHLQQKLRYWKKEKQNKEDAYQSYLHQQVVDKKLKPIYERRGKIDTYRLRPVFDQETERMQTEIWSIQEKIQLTSAKLQEEKRVQRVRQETAQRLANNQEDIVRLRDELETMAKKQKVQELFRRKAKTMRGQLADAEREREETAQRLANNQADIMRLEDELETMGKRQKVQQLFRRKAKSLRGQLADAQREREQIRREAESSMSALRKEYASSIEDLQLESSKRLSEKEQEIGSLAEEIQNLVVGLKEKRNELGLKETIITLLESELQEQESTLATLSQERESLRSLARQSWRVVKARFFRRRSSVGRGDDRGTKKNTAQTEMAASAMKDEQQAKKTKNNSMDKDKDEKGMLIATSDAAVEDDAPGGGNKDVKVLAGRMKGPT